MGSTCPFENDRTLSEKINLLRETLDRAKASLNKVRPADPTKEEVTGSVYYAVEADFAATKNTVADLQGLFEKKTMNFGDQDATKSAN